jgi:hypothetical protein
MPTTFDTFVNNTYATLASAHASGATSLVLGSGQGAQFGSSFPMLVTVIKAGTYRTPTETLCLFSVTGRSTDTLTVSATPAESMSDPGFAIGDVVEMRFTAGQANLFSTSINAIQAIGVNPVVNVASLATGGAGTSASPYTGWDAAAAAAVADNTLFLFDGWFSAAENIVCDNHTNIHLVGRDGHLGQTTFNTPAVGSPSCVILFAINGPNVSFQNTVGCGVTGLTIRSTATSALVTALVTACSGSTTNATLGFTLRDVGLDAKAGGSNPLCCLNLDGTVETTCDNVLFYGAQYGVIGASTTAGFATAVRILGGRFESQTTVPVENPGTQWLLENVVFEPMNNNHASWLSFDYAELASDITLINCYQWDNSAGGTVIAINYGVANLTLIGCLTNSVGGVVIGLANGIALSGLVITGCSFENNGAGSGNGTLFPTTGWSSASITNAFIAGNIFQTGIDNIASAVTGGQIKSGLVLDSAGNTYLPAAAPLTLGTNRITFGSAHPSSGTWAQGDVCFNTGVTASTSPGWSCTSGGTSGTWTAWPNL